LKRQVASKHDSRDFIEKIQSSCGIQLGTSRSSQVEVIEPDEGAKFVIVEGKYTFVSWPNDESSSAFLPFIGSQAAIELFPSVRVDDGAIKYIIKGADIMRPGIVRYDDWGARDRLVIVRDDSKGRGLAVGRTMVESAEMPSLSKGNCIKNLHHAGDKFWTSYRRI